MVVFPCIEQTREKELKRYNKDSNDNCQQPSERSTLTTFKLNLEAKSSGGVFIGNLVLGLKFFVGVIRKVDTFTFTTAVFGFVLFKYRE